MSRAVVIRTLLIVAVLCCSSLLAQPQTTAPAAKANLQTLHDAIFAPGSDPQPQIVLCSPMPSDVCVYKNCTCYRMTCSRCGVQSFTCDEATGQSSCVCKTC
jgi:hypothetical protein